MLSGEHILSPRKAGANRAVLDVREKVICFLQWMTGFSGTQTASAASYNYSRSSANEDITFLLLIIPLALKDEIKWPDVQERLQLSAEFEAILGQPGCVGIIDGKAMVHVCNLQAWHLTICILFHANGELFFTTHSFIHC
jgi:hypothetical protein